MRKTSADGNHISRRQFGRLSLDGLGLVSVSFLVARWGKASSGSDLTVFEWGGNDKVQLYDSYVKKYGSPPRFAFFGDDEEAISKVRGGYTPDVAHPSSNLVFRWHDAGLIREIETSKLSNWPNVYDILKNIPGTQTPLGKQLFIPAQWGTSSVMFRTDLVDRSYLEPENQTWNILWDERYRGRISPRGAVESCVLPAALLLHMPDPWLMNSEQLSRTKALLAKQRALARFYWTDETSLTQAMASGEIVVATAWNSSYATLKQQGVPVAYMKPKEGMLTWVDGFVLCNGGTGVLAQAYDFIDAWLSPESGKFLIESGHAASTNRKAYDLVSKKVLESQGLGDIEHTLLTGLIQKSQPPAVRKAYVDMFQQMKAGY